MKASAGGIAISVDVRGSGQPLLLLHGFTGSKATWAPFLDRWSQRYQTIAVDLVGHGETEAPDAVDLYTMEAAANQLASLLSHLKVSKAHVLGYSMGGRLALYLAIYRPELVANVLLESASPGLSAAGDRFDRIRRDEALADSIIADGVAAFVRQWEKQPLFASQSSLPAEAKLRLEKERLSQTPLGLANSLRGMGTGRQPSLWEKLNICRSPVWLVAGELDTKFTEIADRMAERLPNAEKIIVKGAGHAVHLEKPEIFGKIVYEDFFHHVVERVDEI
ncbi:2-succinyl-6-hydroxy-2,4-cyclohexadiene-1-carboxylate synthase [Camelliibacillus cellulosilyticus]|uniref:Putative 2-succinyl-6-hydroxy-2,4-cyclohexadiene-1-carboxylate synthase n=1 Tax=Camelliibacillus cellulosilyticus TaxID=2174486 RepID=A0ABV9GNN1_9BACL